LVRAIAFVRGVEQPLAALCATAQRARRPSLDVLSDPPQDGLPQLVKPQTRSVGAPAHRPYLRTRELQKSSWMARSAAPASSRRSSSSSNATSRMIAAT